MAGVNPDVYRSLSSPNGSGPPRLQRKPPLRLLRPKGTQLKASRNGRQPDSQQVSSNGEPAFSRQHTPIQRGQKVADLLEEELPAVQEIVPGLLFEGLSILVGKPKIGKSRLLLSLAVAIATGGTCLGSITVDEGDVLYIALEDNKRRLQKHFRKMLQGQDCPDTLEYEREWRRLDAGGIEDLENWIERHPQAKLIVIDTLKKVKPRRRHRGNIYDADYEALEPLQAFASRHPGLAVVLNHHENKREAVDDWIDRASGSAALTGNTDGVMSLRRQRGGATAILTIVHRDIEEESGQYEYALQGEVSTGVWELLGEATPYLMSPQQQEIYRIIQEAARPISPQAIARRLGKTDEKSMSSLYVQLNRMVNNHRIIAAGHGRYCLSPQ
jgi:hypothetical protein